MTDLNRSCPAVSQSYFDVYHDESDRESDDKLSSQKELLLLLCCRPVATDMEDDE